MQINYSHPLFFEIKYSIVIYTRTLHEEGAMFVMTASNGEVLETKKTNWVIGNSSSSSSALPRNGHAQSIMSFGSRQVVFHADQTSSKSANAALSTQVLSNELTLSEKRWQIHKGLSKQTILSKANKSRVFLSGISFDPAFPLVWKQIGNSSAKLLDSPPVEYASDDRDENFVVTRADPKIFQDAFKELPPIQEFSAADCALNDDCVQVLCKAFAKSLQVLDLSGNSALSCRSLEHIAQLQELRQLRLCLMEVGANDVLSNFLFFNKGSEQTEIMLFTKLKKLTHLDISHNEALFAAKGMLLVFANIPTLQVLTIRHKTTPVDLSKFKELRPTVKIITS